MPRPPRMKAYADLQNRADKCHQPGRHWVPCCITMPCAVGLQWCTAYPAQLVACQLQAMLCCPAWAHLYHLHGVPAGHARGGWCAVSGACSPALRCSVPLAAAWPVAESASSAPVIQLRQCFWHRATLRSPLIQRACCAHLRACTISAGQGCSGPWAVMAHNLR